MKDSAHQNDLDVKVPQSWSNTARTGMTKSLLTQTRIDKSKPHLSYDIDGDGVVSSKDLFFARKFDTESTGRLNKD